MKILSDDSIGALMDRRLSIIEKTFSLCIVSFLIFGFNVFAFDNIVENGTFDNDLEQWDVINSPQFSIDVIDEQARISGDGTSMWWDINSDFDDGTYYNLERVELQDIQIEGETISSFLTLSNTKIPLIINPTFNNNSSWNYSEYGKLNRINASINNETLSFDVNSTNLLLKPLIQIDTGVVINQTVIIPSDGFLDSKISYKHEFFNNTSGNITSNMTLKSNNFNYTIFNEITNVTTNWTSEKYISPYVTSGTIIDVTLNTTHELVVNIGNNQTSKTTKWDDCYINITSYYSNGSYISDEIDASENCSWNQLETYTNFNPISPTDKHIVYFRSGDSSTYDGTWSSWSNIGEPEKTILINGIYKNNYNVTGFGQYSQYKIEWIDTVLNTLPKQCYGVLVGGIIVSDNVGTASMIQTISKPYTIYTSVEYDQQIILSDVIDCNITVKFGNNILTSYNISESNGSVESFSYNISGLVDTMGDYDLNFTVETTFASPNVTIVRIPIDVVFALDSSGSMGTEDMDNLKDATKNLIGIMNETDRVAIFTYDDGGSEVVRPILQEEYAYMTSANKTLFNASIDSITSNGYTPFYDTVGEAINYTQNNKISGRLEYVIAMTDGDSNSDDDWSPEDIWGNITTSDPNDYDDDDLNQSTKGLKGLLESPCIVYTIGLGISHDSSYPSAPNWSYVPPSPNTGVEYDVWNVASSSPDLLYSEGGKYGTNETGVDNTGRYFYTDDSDDLPSIFESLYGSTYISEVSGINCTCVVNIDNVRVLIAQQTPVVVSFYVRDSTPVSFDFYGTFTDYTLNETYDFDTEGIKSINIIVADTYNLTVTDITHLGNGVYEFEYTWNYPPVALNKTTLMDTYAVVIDNTGNVGIDYVSIARPTVLSVLIYVGSIFLVAYIILTICRLLRNAFIMEKMIK